MTYQQVCLYRIIALSTCELMRYILRNLSINLPYPNTPLMLIVYLLPISQHSAFPYEGTSLNRLGEDVS